MQFKLSYKTAFYFSLTISTLLVAAFVFMYIYYQYAILPIDVEHMRHIVAPQTVTIHLAYSYLTTFFLSFVLFVLNFRLLSLQLRPRRRIALLIVLTFVTTLFLSTLFSTRQLVINHFEHIKYVVFSNFVRDQIIALVVFFTTQLLNLSNKQQRTALENRELVAENFRTRYEALKNQVDPHFLFNSLNTLNTMIVKDAEKAQQYVQQLSYVFRYTLQNREIISLEEELNYTKAYCHLMQIRYGGSLHFEYRIDPRFHDYSIIPLSLQTLVENAIKHNIVSAKHPLTITLSTADDDTISVSNPIQPKIETEKGEGVGLVNLAERYRLMWQREIAITKDDDIFKVEIFLLKTNA